MTLEEFWKQYTDNLPKDWKRNTAALKMLRYTFMSGAGAFATILQESVKTDNIELVETALDSLHNLKK